MIIVFLEGAGRGRVADLRAEIREVKQKILSLCATARAGLAPKGRRRQQGSTQPKAKSRWFGNHGAYRGLIELDLKIRRSRNGDHSSGGLKTETEV